MSRNPNSATYSNFSCQVCMWWNRFPLTALQSSSVPISCYQGTDNKAHNESDIALNVSRICQKDFSNLQKLHQKLMMVLFTFCIYFCSCLHWAEQDTCYQFCREAAVWKSHCKEQSQFAHPSGNLYLAPMVILNNVNSFVSWPFNTYFSFICPTQTNSSNNWKDFLTFLWFSNNKWNLKERPLYTIYTSLVLSKKSDLIWIRSVTLKDYCCFPFIILTYLIKILSSERKST